MKIFFSDFYLVERLNFETTQQKKKKKKKKTKLLPKRETEQDIHIPAILPTNRVAYFFYSRKKETEKKQYYSVAKSGTVHTTPYMNMCLLLCTELCTKVLRIELCMYVCVCVCPSTQDKYTVQALRSSRCIYTTYTYT